MIQMIKQGCPPDGFLSWLRVVVTMDDNVQLSTTMAGMIRKRSVLCSFCTSHGMVINGNKTNVLVVNVNNEDREAIMCNDK